MIGVVPRPSESVRLIGSENRDGIDGYRRGPPLGALLTWRVVQGESDAGGVNAIDNASAVTLDMHLQGYLH